MSRDDMSPLRCRGIPSVSLKALAGHFYYDYRIFNVSHKA